MEGWTDAHTHGWTKPKQICSPLFQNWKHKNGKSGAGIKMMKKRSGDMIQYFSIKSSVVGFISLLIEGQRSLISDVGLKSLLHQGLSEPEFYGDLVYKFKKIRGMTDYYDKFRTRAVA